MENESKKLRVDELTVEEREYNVNLTKQMMLDELYNLIQDYKVSKVKVKAADAINAIKQICVMQGYNEPTVSKVIQEIEIDF